MKKSIGIIMMACMTISILVSCNKLNTKTTSKADENFIKFETQDGGLSSLLPYDPKREVQSSSTEVGEMDFNLYYVAKDNSEYGVAHSDFPDVIMQNVNIDKLLDGSRDGMTETTNSKLLNETKISIDKFQGRELKVETENGQRIAINRLFFAENRRYLLSVEKPKGEETGEDVSTVLDSFKLISK